MKDCRGFAVCGGDKRQLYAARALAKDGYDVALWGLQDDRIAVAYPAHGIPAAAVRLLFAAHAGNGGRHHIVCAGEQPALVLD